MYESNKRKTEKNNVYKIYKYKQRMQNEQNIQNNACKTTHIDKVNIQHKKTVSQSW